MASSKSAELKTMVRTISVNDDICVVCFKEIAIRCIMDCEHTICYECATRLRVLCDKLECPICRQETTIAVFTREKGLFRTEFMRALHNEDKYKLALEDESVRREYAALLAHNCPICKEKKRSFGLLKQLVEHVQKEHGLQYCELCIEHLKIFSFERKTYTREKLALHRRKGDADDSSHRGHPLCEFCEKRYHDKDALFMHLRRDHFYCHLCEADGLQLFYDDYTSLANHFRSEHYLCEVGECAEKKFVVFRTSIDLQAHDLLDHGDNKRSRGQMLTLEFNTHGDRRRPQAQFNSGGGDAGGRGGRRRDQRHGRGGRNDAERTEPDPPPPPSPPPPQRVDTTSTQEFPTLAGQTGTAAEESVRGGSLAQRVATAAGKTVRNAGSKGRPWDNRAVNVTEEEFPTLGGGASGPAPTPQQTQRSSQVDTYSASSRRGGGGKSVVKGQQSSKPNLDDDFPSLGGATAPVHTLQPTKSKLETSMSAAVSRRDTNNSKQAQNISSKPVKSKAEDFPSLAPLAPRPSVTVSAARPKTAPVVKKSAAAAAKPAVSAGSGSGAQKKGGKGGGGGGGGGGGKPANGLQVEFKRRPASMGAAAALAAAQMSSSAADFYESDEEPPPSQPKRQEVQSSNITMAPRAAEPTRPSAPAHLPPPPDAGDFPSLGKPAAPATWVKPSKAKPKESKKKPEPEPKPVKSTEEEFPTLGPVAAHGNFRNFLEAGKTSWTSQDSNSTPSAPSSGSGSNAAKNQKKNKKTKYTASREATSADSGQNGGVGEVSDAVNGLSISGGGGARPPPGLVAPPPGFQRDGSPPERWEDALEDTQTGRAPISGDFEYIQPDNFAVRNEKLMRMARELFNGDDFDTFKAISRMYLEGSLSAEDYYRSCLERLGNDRFGKIFSELLVLMPNIRKQQELLAAHGKLNKNGFSRNKFPSCPTCQQVLIFVDMASHVQKHAENDDFPALS